MGNAEVGRGFPDTRDATGIKLGGRVFRRHRNTLLDSVLRHRRIESRAEGRIHGLERLRIRMAHIDAEEHLARDGVSRIGADLHHADGGDSVGRLILGDQFKPGDDPGRRLQRVMTRRHGRGAGMGLAARERDLIGTLALAAGDDADDLLFRFEDGPLFDMGLEIGGDCGAADGGVAHVADAPQFITEALARPVLLHHDVFVFEHAGEDARAAHGRREAASFLVGPDGDLYRRVRFQLQVIQGAHHFKPGQHPVDPIEAAAGRLRVQMAAGHDGGPIRVPPGTAGEDIADGVDTDLATGIDTPSPEQMPGFPVFVAQGQPAHAAGRRRADFIDSFDAFPKPISVGADGPMFQRRGHELRTPGPRLDPRDRRDGARSSTGTGCNPTYISPLALV